MFLLSFLLQGYKYEYHVEPLNASCNAADRNNQGIAYMEMGQYNHAIASFKLAIKLSPNAPASAAYYNNLGLAYMRLGAYSLAEPCFKKSAELNPVFIEYYINLVSVYAKNGTIYNELEKYNLRISSDDNDSMAYFMQGLIYKQLGEDEKAVKSLKKYTSIEKENVLSRGAKQLIFEIKDKKIDHKG